MAGQCATYGWLEIGIASLDRRQHPEWWLLDGTTVFVLEEHISGSTWLAYDANSGAGGHAFIPDRSGASPS